MSSPDLAKGAPGSSIDPAVVFAALGDPTRLSLMGRLADGSPRSIVALSADTTLTRQAVTKHLRVLERADLVRSLKVGRESRWAARPEALDAARTWLDQVSARWDAALARLQALVEA